jgi:Ca2+-binding EF-hand superfamily protein
MPGIGAAGARAGHSRAKQKIGKNRADWVQANSIKLASDEVRIRTIFAKYDTNSSEALEFDQLKAFLSDLLKENQTEKSKKSGEEHLDFASHSEVSDEDVNFILLTCDKDKSKSIKKTEVLFALKVWTTYLDHQVKIDEAFKKFDTDKSNSLDKEQLRACLEELNSGEPVTDEEVEHVMTKGDVLGDGVLRRIEFLVALAAWYASAEVKQEKAAVSSACCTVQ